MSLEKLWQAVNELRSLSGLDPIFDDQEPVSVEPGPGPGGLALKELDFAAILYDFRRRFGEIEKGGLRAASIALAGTLYEVAVAVVEPWSSLFYRLSHFLADAVLEMSSSYMADVGFRSFAEGMAETAYAYEHEKGREAPLTAGEFYWTIAANLRAHLTFPLLEYRSPILPTGLRQPENLGVLAGKVQAFAYSAARWYGCWRSPIIDREDDEPVDWDNLPFSVGGRR